MLMFATTLLSLTLLIQPYATAQSGPAVSNGDERLVVFEIFMRGT